MEKRTALITGATGGIGQATALGLARQGFDLILVGRNASRLEQTKATVRQETGNQRIETLNADLSSLEDVRRLAGAVQQRFGHLNVLINNAGITPSSREVTVDGFEMQFAVNYLAPFLLTQLLLPVLRTNAPTRIINVASSAAGMGKLDLDQLQSERGYDMTSAYARSKLALLMFTVSLADRLEPQYVTVNALDPGWTDTPMTRGMESSSGLLGVVNRIGKWIPLRKGADTGALNSIYLASSDAVQTTTGLFFSKNHRITRMPASVGDTALRERLWIISEGLTGMSFHPAPAQLAPIAGAR